MERKDILELVEPKRMEHVLGVEAEAVRLACFWGADRTLARDAALLHDCTKGWTKERHLQFCREYNIILSELETDNPKLLHGITGAELAVRRFGACREVAGAVRWHTVGRPEMTMLEKIIYLADKIEPGRHYEGVELYRGLAYQDLNRALLAVMDGGLLKLVKNGRFIHPDTLTARNFYLLLTEGKSGL